MVRVFVYESDRLSLILSRVMPTTIKIRSTSLAQREIPDLL